MFDKHGFGEMPFEHIPKGLPNPGREVAKRLSPGELLRKVTWGEEEPPREEVSQQTEVE